MGERRFDDGSNVGERWASNPHESNERGFDAGTRSKHGRRHRVETRLPRSQLNQHGDRAVGFGARLGEESLGDLALHHHAPALERWNVLQRLDDQWRCDVVREVRDELSWPRFESGEIEA